MHKHILMAILCMFLIAACGVTTVSAFADNEARLTINSEPSGATVTVSGDFVGYTPVSTIIPGSAMVNLRVEVPGNTYEVWKGSAYVPAGQDVSMNVTVYKKTEGAKDTGVIVVTSGTEGAQVYLDNSYYGSIAAGSFSIDSVKLGLHSIEVKADGYNTYTALIEVQPKNFATANVVADLTPIPSGTGTPAPADTPGSTSVPPAPTKSPVWALLPILALLGAAAVLRK